jgi:hypothetical protein
MNIIIKYNEKTSGENQMFVLDMNKHYQIFALEDNIYNYTSSYVAPYTPPEPKIDLSKYEGFEVYGIFKSYSRIDGFSIFEIDTLQIDRDLKINEILE